jgi:tubulin polyglutamylase TTLL5
MYRTISKLREIHGPKHFGFIPKTFILPNEYSFLEEEMKKDPQKLWIAKPAASSMGRGILVTNKLDEIPHREKQFVVSEYIDNPLLFNGYKFDLRIYVAITSINPLRLYIYEEGLTRFCTTKYNTQQEEAGTKNNKSNKFMHLTNFSVNKKNSNFVANANLEMDGQGSKWSVTALRKAFREQGIDDKAIWIKI